MQIDRPQGTIVLLLLLMALAPWPYYFMMPRAPEPNGAGESRKTAAIRARTDRLQQTVANLREDYQRALDLLETSFGRPVNPAKVNSLPVTITAYSSTPDQCDSTPHITASNQSVRTGVIAVSDDLIEEHGLAFGQRVLIPGHGLFEVQDRMNPRWQRRVDIWTSDRKAARIFGIRQGTLLWIHTPPRRVAQRRTNPES